MPVYHKKVLRIAADITHASFISSRSISALVSAMYSEGYRMNELSEQVKSGFRKLFCKQKH